MSIAKMFLFAAVAIFLVASLATGERDRSRLSQMLIDDDRPHRALRKRDRENDSWYFEQCRSANVWKEQLGHVSVLAFLDPSWQYSFRQAVMLKLLSARLQRSGFPDVRFYVIAPPHDLTEDRLENELEVQAWREIPIYESANPVDEAYDRHPIDGGSSDMIFVQDNPQIRVWERFRATKDQVVVVDRFFSCGKLTYQVMVPWSILYFPYVKAAILSTYREDPCGACDPAVYEEGPNREAHIPPTSINETRRTEESERVNADRIAPESFAVRESSEEEEARATLFSRYDGTTNDNVLTDLPSATEDSFTENSYRYENEAIEFPFRENDPNIEETRGREQSADSTNGVSVTTVMEREESTRTTPTNDSGARNDRLDESTSDAAKTAPDGTSDDGNANIGAESSFIEYRRDDSLDGENAVSASLPLRIILYAPHMHRDRWKTSKYTHLILKTGSPNYHGHLDPGDDFVASSSANRQGADLLTTDSEKRDWEGIKVDANDEGANQKFMYDRDESPGLYGEVADYSRSFEDGDIADRNETSNDDDYRNSTIDHNEEYDGNIGDHSSQLSETNKNYLTAKITTDTKISVSEPQDIIRSDEIDSYKVTDVGDQFAEEELQDKLIEHYNKLLPWIYYILNN